MCGCQVQKKIPWLLAEILKDLSSSVSAAYYISILWALFLKLWLLYTWACTYPVWHWYLFHYNRLQSKNVQVWALMLVEPIMVSVQCTYSRWAIGMLCKSLYCTVNCVSVRTFVYCMGDYVVYFAKVSFTSLHGISPLRLFFDSVVFCSCHHWQFLLCSLAMQHAIFEHKCNRPYTYGTRVHWGVHICLPKEVLCTYLF